MLGHYRILALAAALAAAPAFAQTPSPTPAIQTPPGKSLSDKLNHANGVIHPKNVDPGIEKPAPSTGDADVIKPNAAPTTPAVPK